ncbi:MAG: hypothetical protein J2P38_09830 [Candidatus Dormibacteraeota bacterium]|nr:hypothetical protein [Candidatus Dormibacteraeota bacterium]
MPVWYLGLVATSGLLRLVELRRSSSNERAVGAADVPAAGSYPKTLVLHIALHTLPLAEVALFRRRARLPWVWVGVLVGTNALRWWSIASLGAAWNARGAVPDRLPVVTRGPYRFVRHPNYIAVGLEFLAIPLAGGAWLSALVLSALEGLTLAERVREEERRLFTHPDYRAAFAGRKRFIPGVF